MLGKADWLLRSVTSWPATYFAFLFSFITHAIASIIKDEDGGGGTLEEMEEVIEMRDQSLANEEEEEKDEAPVFTRAGRQVQRPQKYQ